MAKSKPKNRTIQSVPTPIQFPRLEGDELLLWGRMTEKLEQAVMARQQVAAQFLEKRGFKPGDYLLSDDGYIVTPADVERQKRVRSLPVPPSSGDSGEPTADPSPPDSGS